jgi:bacterioferritin
MANDDKIAELNRIFAEEVEAALRYLHLAVTTKGIDRIRMKPFLMEGFEETVEHAQVVAEKIIQFGGVPSLKLQLELQPIKCTGEEAIRTALAFEQAALDAYRDALDKAEGDIVMEEFIRAQIATESEHVSSLYQLLED